MKRIKQQDLKRICQPTTKKANIFLGALSFLTLSVGLVTTSVTAANNSYKIQGDAEYSPKIPNGTVQTFAETMTYISDKGNEIYLKSNDEILNSATPYSFIAEWDFDYSTGFFGMNHHHAQSLWNVDANVEKVENNFVKISNIDWSSAVQITQYPYFPMFEKIGWDTTTKFKLLDNTTGDYTDVFALSKTTTSEVDITEQFKDFSVTEKDTPETDSDGNPKKDSDGKPIVDKSSVLKIDFNKPIDLKWWNSNYYKFQMFKNKGLTDSQTINFRNLEDEKNWTWNDNKTSVSIGFPGLISKTNDVYELDITNNLISSIGTKTFSYTVKDSEN